MDIIALLKDWIIPLGSVVLSIWYAASAKKDAERSDANVARLEKVVGDINAAVQGWQAKIMDSANSLLNANPQILMARAAETRIDVARAMADEIKEHAKNKNGMPQAEHEQIMIALSSNLQTMLQVNDK